MSGFHCPVGAVGYKSFGCIECGMCNAATKEEITRATEIIRAHIREVAASRPNKRRIQKVAVCGKGGSGKSTITAMLAFALRDLGYTPLVIDTDDSNAGLNRKLGMTETPLPLITCLPRFAIGESVLSTEWLEKDPIRIQEIPEEYIKEKDGILFMMSGKIENPLQGCSCTISDITKQLVSNLEIQEKEILLVDHDAGIESFGRGAEQGMDTVLIVVEPSYESVGLAETIQYMAEGLGIQRIRTIINKITDEEEDETVREMLSDKEIRFLGSLPVDRSLMRSNLKGEPVESSPLQEELKKIAKLMLDEADMGYRKNV